MKISMYFLLLAVVLSTSCKDDEDAVPQSFLNGTYEIAGENSDTGIWYVSQYIFGSDGSYEYLNLLRENGNTENLGYYAYSKGTYSLRGEDLVLKMSEASSLNFEDYPEGYTESLEDLETQEFSTDFVESKGVLKKLENGKKISILFECNDMLSDYSSICTGALIYNRVD